ncbi:MAG: nucleobase:cation symporter-2 family protein [Tissierellia bacterium]|nr:nucleobase:cation symporter-2 family protein [Tissierellia bacterium]
MEKSNTSVFDLDGRPSFGKALPLALQHVLAMLVGNIVPSIIIAGVTGLTPEEKVAMIQVGMIIAALSTFIQLVPVLGFGARLPVIMGVSFSYIPVLTAIGKAYGIQAVFGAQLIGAIVSIFVGVFIKQIRSYFPPIVAGTVVFTIGLSLYPVGINYMAGGVGAPDYGNLKYWGVALFTLLVVLVCNMFGKGMIKLAAILIGMVAGYIVSLALNMVSFENISNAGWFALPRPFYFGYKFQPTAVISMVVMYIVNSVQAVGDFSATTMGGLNREATDEELSGAIKGNGICSAIASAFGGLPTASYSQNVGIVSMTKVVSLYVFKVAVVIILIAGLIPKFGAIMTTIPYPVLGGATISVFAMITMTGMRLITQGELSTRNLTIVGLSVALGVGMTGVSESISQFPEWFKMVFGASPVVIATTLVFFLNILMPKKSLAEEQMERDKFENN